MPKESKDKLGCTALHVAVKFGLIETTQHLLNHKLDVDAKTKLGESPGHLALKSQSARPHHLSSPRELCCAAAHSAAGVRRHGSGGGFGAAGGPAEVPPARRGAPGQGDEHGGARPRRRHDAALRGEARERGGVAALPARGEPASQEQQGLVGATPRR